MLDNSRRLCYNRGDRRQPPGGRDQTMGGKKKSQRRLSWRDWKPPDDVRLREIIDSGGDYADVAKALGRSELGVMLHAKRVGILMTKTKAQLTAIAIMRLLGL